MALPQQDFDTVGYPDGTDREQKAHYRKVESLAEMLPRVIDLVDRSVAELKDLRRHNEVLSAKVETFELCARFLNAQAPTMIYGASEDIAWALERMLKDLQQFGAATP